MAKSPKNPLDEVEIIRRRDGVADTTPDGQLNGHVRRALADSRLRALAMALNVEQTSHDADGPDDAELLAYLLDMLPEQRRNELEIAFRGNARTFGRLMQLYAPPSTLKQISATGVEQNIPRAMFPAAQRKGWRCEGLEKRFSFGRCHFEHHH